jgi:hypothetical protein
MTRFKTYVPYDIHCKDEPTTLVIRLKYKVLNFSPLERTYSIIDTLLDPRNKGAKYHINHWATILMKEYYL